MARIVIVEDDINIRRELMKLLANAGYETAELAEFSNPADNILEQMPDLVLLDMNLPGMNGLSICDSLRRRSQVPVIFVTSNNTSMDELNCMMRGGDDYIAKPYQVPILLARIAAVLKRTMKREGQGAVRLEHKGLVLDVAAGILRKEAKQTELTKNELKILYCLFEHAGEIVSRADLIEYLWDNEVFIDDNTLSVNVTRIRSKLDELKVPDFIETKRGLGYRI